MKTSTSQFELMISFMEQHGDLSKPTSSARGKMATMKLWDELNVLLNSDPSGDSKTIEKWKKVWSDYKNNTKKKAARLHKSVSGTGGGPAIFAKMTDLEQRVLHLMGIQVATGMAVEEAGLQGVQNVIEGNPPVGELSIQLPSTQLKQLTSNRLQPWNQPGPSSASHVAPPITTSQEIITSPIIVVETVDDSQIYDSQAYIAPPSSQVRENELEGEGDHLPPYNGKIRIYNMRYCPYAHRTILALNAKQLDYEVVNIDLMNKPEWISSMGLGNVPILEVEDGVYIYESLIIVEYLDEVYPQRPLISKDPVRKAYDKIIVEAFGSVINLFYQALENPDTIMETSQIAFYKALDFIEDQLCKRGTKFFGGSEPGYADYMMWPWFERIIQLDGIEGHVNIDQQRYKLLMDYIAVMFEDPAVSQYLVPKDIIQTFVNSYRKKIPIDYDMLLKK